MIILIVSFFLVACGRFSWLGSARILRGTWPPALFTSAALGSEVLLVFVGWLQGLFVLTILTSRASHIDLFFDKVDIHAPRTQGEMFALVSFLVASLVSFRTLRRERDGNGREKMEREGEANAGSEAGICGEG